MTPDLKVLLWTKVGMFWLRDV